MVSTLGAKQPQELNTYMYVAQFDIAMQGGSRLSVEADVLKQIMKPISRRPLQNSDWEYLCSFSHMETLRRFYPTRGRECRD